MTAYDALVVVSFGGPEGPDDVIPFLENVTRGRDVPRERLDQAAAQYQLFGGVSPINAHNRALVAAIEAELAEHGPSLPVYWGNRNWKPYLVDTIRQMRDDGVQRSLAFVTAAYSSYSACRQYLEDIARARAEIGDGAPIVDKIRQFYDHPGFVEPMARNLRAAIDSLPSDLQSEARVVFSAHSVPIAMATSSAYVAQLLEAARLVAERGAPDHTDHGRELDLVWQSRSGPPQVPWLEPDIGDHLEALAADGVRAAVVVPIGFISDHMEVVYDLDTVAAERAHAAGLTMVRCATAGSDPQFASMVRQLVLERMPDASGQEHPRLALGSLGIQPDQCAADCCPAPAPRPNRRGARKGDAV